VSRPARIAYDDLPDELQEKLAARVRRLGYLGEFFQVAAHQPAALAGFIDYTEALKDSLPARLVETIALSMAAATGNAYERVQHERLALKLGIPEPQIRALVSRRASTDEGFSELELAAIRLSFDVIDARGGSCESSYSRVASLTDDATAVGCLMTAVRYLAHSTMANTWGLAAPGKSPLAETVADG
jgi:alkylhydroperoxidase family enzyme